MNRTSIKLMSVLAIILFVALMPLVVLATNENVSVISTLNNEDNQEYIIYVEGYTDTTFKYAFFNNANPEIMDLVYINSITDLGENQVAYLDAETYEKLKESEETQIYMWAKDENDNLILNGIQLDLENSINTEKLNTVETITKRISVNIVENKTDTEEIRQEEIDGITETSSVGYIEITDNDDAEYYYERVKVTDSEDYQKLMELALTINEKYDELDMYEKIQISQQFYSLYSELVEQVNWQEVENMKVYQPESTIEGEGTGDQYLVFLKKVDGEEEVTDVQFLTAYYDYEPNLVKEQVITQETTTLPITYDSIFLIVILAVIIVAIVIVYIRMKKLNKKNEEK